MLLKKINKLRKDTTSFGFGTVYSLYMLDFIFRALRFMDFNVLFLTALEDIFETPILGTLLA